MKNCLLNSKLIFLLLFFQFSSFAQKADAFYKEGLHNLTSSHSKKADEIFEKAAWAYKKSGNDVGYSKAMLQKIKIKINNKNFKKASMALENLVEFYYANQLANDSLWVEIINTRAINLKQLGKFEKALKVNDKLLNNEKFRNKFKHRIYHTRSRIQIDLGDYSQAISSAKKSLKGYVLVKDSLNQAAIYNIIGVGLYFQEKYDSTLIYYNRSLELKRLIKADFEDLAISTFNIGIVYEALTDYHKALEYYKEAEEYDLLDGDETAGVLTDIYVAMVNSYYNIGDYGNAELYAKKALQLTNKIYGEESTYSSFVYASYANLLEIRNRPKQAIDYVKKALKIRKKTYGLKHRWTFESYLSLGENYLQVNEIDSASVNFEQALSIAKKLNSNAALCFAKKELGILNMTKGNYEEAIKLLLEAEFLSKKVYGTNHNLFFEIKYLLLESHFQNNDFTQARKHIQWFKNTYEKNRNSLIEFFMPDLLSLENRIYERVLIQTDKQGFEKEITANVLSQIAIVEKIRKRYLNNDSRIFVGREVDAAIAYSTGICFRLYNKYKKDRYLEMAFKMSELNRNKILIEGIRQTQFKKVAGVPDSVLERENDLIQAIELTKKVIHYAENTSPPQTKKLDSLLSTLLIFNKELEEHLNELNQNYPKYFDLKYSQKSITVTKLQNTILNADQTFLEYYIGDKEGYVFVLEKSSKKLLKIPEFNKVKELAERVRTKIHNRKNVSKEARQLYTLLLGNLKLKPELIIVADDFLNDIPFEILQNGNEKLINKQLISYVGSANLLEQHKENVDNGKIKSSWYGFSPDFEKTESLSYTKAEVFEIADIMNGKIFAGDAASLKNFREQAEHSSILHLATHAIMDNNNPNYNKLLFSDSSIENELTTSDIYTLALNAEMAVLSACNTGHGIYRRGEGVMNMARAFKYAGVESTVMSLWKVPDKQTSQIMVSFYKYLKKGLPKNKALQQAKQDYLMSTDDELLRHPYYWAGFVLSGNVDPIYDPVSNWWWLLLIPVAAIVWGFMKNKKFSPRL